jgi:hypothetical protein
MKQGLLIDQNRRAERTTTPIAYLFAQFSASSQRTDRNDSPSKIFFGISRRESILRDRVQPKSIKSRSG